MREAFAALDPSGRVGEACWRDYARKLERWNDARGELETLWQRWPAFDAELDAPAGLARAAGRGAARGARARCG